jgi:hypothetical protein
MRHSLTTVRGVTREVTDASRAASKQQQQQQRENNPADSTQSSGALRTTQISSATRQSRERLLRGRGWKRGERWVEGGESE